MNRSYRLTRTKEFKRVRRVGRSYAHPLIVLITQASPDPKVRIGISAGKSVGGAVQRNRAKRLLREAARPLIPFIRTGWDLVLLARQPIGQSTLPEIQKALILLLKRAEIFWDERGS